MNYSQLKVGHKLSAHKYLLDAETVSSYVEAVGDGSSIYSDGTMVPPTALAALSLKGIIDDLAIPGGTVHVAQELEFAAQVKVGQELTCRANLVQNAVRGQSRFLSVEAVVQDDKGRTVMIGKSTIIVPA